MAKRNIESAYAQWMAGYGSISWTDYLQKLLENPETGEWAKDVAGLLAKERID